MYVCICNAVTERQIRQAVELGAESLRDLADCLNVGTNCGKCHNETCRILHEEKQSAMVGALLEDAFA